MDSRNRVLVVVASGVLSLLVIGSAIYMANSSQRSIDRLQARWPLETERTSPPSMLEGREVAVRISQRDLDRLEAQRVEQLRSLLEKRTTLLDRRTTMLQQKTAEYDALKQEFDAAIALLAELTGERPNSVAPDATGSDPGDAAAGDPGGSPVDTAAAANGNGANGAATANRRPEVERLRAELSRTELDELSLAAELEQLRVELEKTDQEIAALQRQAELEIAALSVEKELLQTAAYRAFARAGPAAVPGLVELLHDDQPAVRRWAVEVLSDLGTAARSAAGELEALLSDPDMEVRQAAREALEAVDP